ncbi:ubiquitin-conjugating enzyme E2 Z-like [Panulirus ornatus]|uniref:ubiquitin-conjugating enzyme E2 Z-like n=1 Tax=Panulirus ornatus TaxID=150431 RepID=UPI003A8B49EA
MEPQSTVAEADSTSVLPPLESLSNVHPSQSISTLSSPSQSPPVECPSSQSPSTDYLPSSSPPAGSSPSQSSAWAFLLSESLFIPSLQSSVNTPVSQSPSAGLPYTLPTTVSSSSQSPTVMPLSLPSSVMSSTLSSAELPPSQSPPTELLTLNSHPSSCSLAPGSPSSQSTMLPSFSPSEFSLPQYSKAAPIDPDSCLPNMSSKSWRYDPLASPDWDLAGPPGYLCAGRVKKDLSSIFTEPLPGIFAVPEEDNLFKVHCLIIGPFDTPYEGGFFHFLVRFGPQYPLHPPRVRLLTTGGDAVRFNPNLYKNGKVCLSILGTWSGPSWSPASNLSTVLLSLQSLLNERPYHNEPGYEEEHNIGDSDRYNSIIMHETIRVAVIQQLEGNTTAPPDLLKVMQASFMEYYDHYVEICEKNMYKDGQTMDDPFGERRGRFQYSTLMKQLKRLKIKLKANGIPEIPENSKTTESDDVSSISESEEGSPASEGEDSTMYACAPVRS